MTFPVIDTVKTGEKIKTAVKNNGYTAESIRVMLRMGDKSNIYKWFRGESLPTIDNFLALSMLLNVTVNDLIATV